jgi:hypothetical protein
MWHCAPCGCPVAKALYGAAPAVAPAPTAWAVDYVLLLQVLFVALLLSALHVVASVPATGRFRCPVCSYQDIVCSPVFFFSLGGAPTYLPRRSRLLACGCRLRVRPRRLQTQSPYIRGSPTVAGDARPPCTPCHTRPRMFHTCPTHVPPPMAKRAARAAGSTRDPPPVYRFDDLPALWLFAGLGMGTREWAGNWLSAHRAPRNPGCRFFEAVENLFDRTYCRRQRAQVLTVRLFVTFFRRCSVTDRLR